MPPRRLNQDTNYKQAVGEVIGFRQAGLTRLVKVRVLLPPCALVVRTRATCTEADSRLQLIVPNKALSLSLSLSRMAGVGLG